MIYASFRSFGLSHLHPHIFSPQRKSMAVNLSNSFVQTGAFHPAKKVPRPVVSRTPTWTCRKKDIHPQFYEDAKIYCNGELVMTTGGTKKEYVVDVWSGNHPFYQGDRTAVVVEDSQLEKFRKKYQGILPDEWFIIPTLKGEVVLPPRQKRKDKKK